jgi:hypothetical protein
VVIVDFYSLRTSLKPQKHPILDGQGVGVLAGVGIGQGERVGCGRFCPHQYWNVTTYFLARSNNLQLNPEKVRNNLKVVRAKSTALSQISASFLQSTII